MNDQRTYPGKKKYGTFALKVFSFTHWPAALILPIDNITPVTSCRLLLSTLERQDSRRRSRCFVTLFMSLLFEADNSPIVS